MDALLELAQKGPAAGLPILPPEAPPVRHASR